MEDYTSKRRLNVECIKSFTNLYLREWYKLCERAKLCELLALKNLVRVDWSDAGSGWSCCCTSLFFNDSMSLLLEVCAVVEENIFMLIKAFPRFLNVFLGFFSLTASFKVSCRDKAFSTMPARDFCFVFCFSNSLRKVSDWGDLITETVNLE